jgi:hypothetical protein
MEDQMQVGDEVEKIRGYKWPGVVVSVFHTLAGDERVVVECTVPEVAGALHIYAPEQLTVTRVSTKIGLRKALETIAARDPDNPAQHIQWAVAVAMQGLSDADEG